jgi:hypothetical protein
MESQEFSVARITRVKEVPAVSGGFGGVALSKVLIVTSFFSSTLELSDDVADGGADVGAFDFCGCDG